QETRRASAAAARNGGGAPALSQQVDSLLMIEEKLTEVIDSMTNLVGADHERIRALEEQLRVLQSAGGQGTPLPPSDPSGDPPGESYIAPPPLPRTAPATLQERYNNALGLFHDNNFSEALAAFQSLDRDDPHGAFASNYQYWEGECYYGEHQYNEALQTFGRMMERYPNSPKAAAAEFKLGECYERLNIPRSARNAYERVIADYPNSEFRSRAQARLKLLQ
ncbi:MAG TPA: tetratricopeptide repeat protein, partial [Candidatus Kapabacteria bacterium]|nr:tetratricopeptide repeat protein [Candidatus Kapabacteria bacterium]